MRLHRKLIAGLALCLALTSSALANENTEKAAQLFDQGLVVLAQGNFDGAMKAFAGAAKTDPANQNYKQHLALVNRVKQVRAMNEKEQNVALWTKQAESLRTFYMDYEVFAEALAIDQRRFKKLGTPATAVDLAESQLELGKNAESVKLLVGLDKAMATPRSDVLLGIGLARLGKMDDAKAVAGNCAAQVDSKDLALLFDAACLNSLVGNQELAAKQLTLTFEQTPPAQLVKAKTYAKKRHDLAGLTSAQYAGVWTVESKIKPAACGSAAGCGGCSKAGDAGGCSDEEKDGADCGTEGTDS